MVRYPCRARNTLFATTALVALAGAAAAEVTITGSAEMGVAGGDGTDLQFHQSVDVRFAMTGETDGGLTFGATVDLDDITDMGNSGNGSGDIQGANPDFTVTIGGAFGTLTMGDTDGAFDARLTEVAIGASLADDHTGHAGFSGNAGLDGALNGQVARYDYSFGDFTISASAEVSAGTDAVAGTAIICQNTTTGAVRNLPPGSRCAATGETLIAGTAQADATDQDSVLGIGASWSGDMGGMTLGLGAGYQTQDNGGVDIFGVSASIAANGFTVVLNYSDLDGMEREAADEVDVATDSHAAIGVGYTTGALTMSANYGVYDYADGTEDKGWGAAINYDLGGGVVAQVGYGDSDIRDGSDDATWSAGLAMTF